MARHINVYRVEDLPFVSASPTSDVYSPDFDKWTSEVSARCLYENPLGSESEIWEFWSEPAARLGLPLLASIYDVGFYTGCEWSGGDLDVLDHELDIIEQHWSGSELADDDRADLAERVTWLREAIAVARGSDGVICIG